MKIHTKFRIGTIVITSLTLVFSIVISSLLFRQQKFYQKTQIVEKVIETSFQLALLQSEYVAHPGDRPKAQWINVDKVQSGLLDQSRALFTAPPEKHLFEEIQEISEENKVLLVKLIENSENNADRTIIEELNNQMIQKTQSRVSDALQLAAIARDAAKKIGQEFFLAVLLLGIFAVLISILLSIAGIKIARTFQKLGEGMKIIAHGDLSYRLQIRSADEIGELAELFDNMSLKLKEANETLEKNVQERTVQLRQTNAFLDAIIENIPNMIFLKDAKDLRFVLFNKAGEELLGLDRKELLGKNDYDLFPKEQADFFVNKDRKVLKQRTLVDIPCEPIQTRLKGTRFLHTKKITIRDSGGKSQFLLGISSDITERKNFEEEKESEERAKSEFVCLASHQLRTPLTEIRWALSSLMREKLSVTQKKVVESAHKASGHMAETIKAMLTISHIETGQINPELTDVLLSPLIEDVAGLYETMRRKKAIVLDIDCPKEAQVHTDQQLLKEALSNLLTNAYKYTQKDGNVSISVHTDDGNTRIDVADTGCGIPQNEQSRIFEKFFRASNVVGQSEEGNGIGLHMAHSLMKLLGGTLSFASKEHHGTTFSITFPPSQ